MPRILGGVLGGWAFSYEQGTLYMGYFLKYVYDLQYSREKQAVLLLHLRDVRPGWGGIKSLNSRPQVRPHTPTAKTASPRKERKRAR